MKEDTAPAAAAAGCVILKTDLLVLHCIVVFIAGKT